MKISWDISDNDVYKLNKFLKNSENPFLERRKEKNVNRQNVEINENVIIKTMLACLLTSQQRSGPNSNVGKFLQKNPFPLLIQIIEQTNNVENLVKRILEENGLTRYINRISKFFAKNIVKIQRENWIIINELKRLIKLDSKEEERKYADFLAVKFDGFGPKQSRNFLQSLGLTKYEIPIDSRITNWLNNFGFPIKLTSPSLSDKEYYHFVSNGIQELCKKAEIYPCMFDAAIFSSYDNDEWTKGNSIF